MLGAKTTVLSNKETKKEKDALPGQKGKNVKAPPSHGLALGTTPMHEGKKKRKGRSQGREGKV